MKHLAGFSHPRGPAQHHHRRCAGFDDDIVDKDEPLASVPSRLSERLHAPSEVCSAAEVVKKYSVCRYGRGLLYILESHSHAAVGQRTCEKPNQPLCTRFVVGNGKAANLDSKSLIARIAVSLDLGPSSIILRSSATALLPPLLVIAKWS